MAQEQWRNRIVGYADVAPEQLLANPMNFRRHPKNQQDALSGVIAEVGYVDPVLVQQGTDVVLDGHLRVELAMRQHQPTIPVKYVDLDDAEAALILATFDPLAALAASDAEQLDALLREVSTSDAAVMQMLSDLAEANGVIPPNTFDANAEWQGMPEFHQEDQTAEFQAIVNFKGIEDMEAFERFIGQRIPRNTRSIWYPAVERANVRDLGYVGDAA